MFRINTLISNHSWHSYPLVKFTSLLAHEFWLLAQVMVPNHGAQCGHNLCLPCSLGTNWAIWTQQRAQFHVGTKIRISPSNGLLRGTDLGNEILHVNLTAVIQYQSWVKLLGDTQQLCMKTLCEHQLNNAARRNISSCSNSTVVHRQT